jgi:hypothetical protein
VPEQTEPLAKAFFTFRLEAPAEITVPGSAAARRTVRRRRTARLATLSLAIVTAIAGIGYVGGLAGGADNQPAHTSPAPVSATSSGYGSLRNASTLGQLGETAAQRLAHETDRQRPSLISGPLPTASSSGLSYAMGGKAPFPAGVYSVHSVCAGEGRVVIRWSAPGAEGAVTVTCGAEPVMTPLQLSEAGTIELHVTPNEQAAGRAGFAVYVSDPLTIVAENALPAHPAQIAGNSGVNYGQFGGTDYAGFAPGTYILAFTCTDVGSFEIVFSLDQTATTRTVACSSSPTVTHIEVKISRTAAELSYLVTPDERARYWSAHSFAVWRK